MSKQHVSFGTEGRVQLTNNVRATKAANLNKRVRRRQHLTAIMRAHNCGLQDARLIYAMARQANAAKSQSDKMQDAVQLASTLARKQETREYKARRSETERQARVAAYLKTK